MDISTKSQMSRSLEDMKALKELDQETAHIQADEILVSALITSAMLTKDEKFRQDVRDLIKAYRSIPKWYA